ncbi:MAG: alpha-amylase, partial [Burkholderiaceae bacterium]
IARGSYEAPVAQGQVLAFQRAWKGQRALVVINYGSEAATMSLPLRAKARLQPVHPATGAAAIDADARGQATITAAPLSVQVWRLR